MRAKSVIRISCLDFAPPFSKAQGKSSRLLPGALAILLLLFGSSLPAAGETQVWIDTDASIGSPFREVDDAFALLLAFKCTSLRIVGISTIYGNASLKRTTAVTTELVSRFSHGVDRKPKVSPGARSRRDLGVETAATKALADAVQENGNLVYLAFGPLTNLATFEIRHPQLATRIKRVIFVGGQTESARLRFGSKHPITIHDANVFQDPEAVRRVLRTNIPMTLMPLRTASDIFLDKDDLMEIGRGSEAGNFLQKNSGAWLWFWTNFVGITGGPVFDAAAVLAAAKPTLLVLETRSVTVNSSGDLLVFRNSIPQSGTVLYCPKLTDTARKFVREKLSEHDRAENKSGQRERQ
jgi:inosine-uridine nucleoside N-ribohydrolase